MIPTLKSQDGQLIIEHNSMLSLATEETFLTADVAAAAGTLTVESISGFAINQVLLIGDYPSEDGAIIKTHSSTTPTGSTITLSANLARGYGAGTRVKVIPYDQFILYHATTATGSKTALTLNSGVVSVSVDNAPQKYNETEFTSGFYFTRYKNSISTTYSDYSDAVEYGVLSENSVGYMINQALRDVKTSLSDSLTKRDCYAWINDGMKLVKGKLRNWPEHFTFDYNFGPTTRGSNVVTMPTDIYDSGTQKSILDLRIGNNSLMYLDPTLFAHLLRYAVHTQVRTAASAGDTTLAIDNSYSFSETGSVNVYVGGTQYNITYTGVTRSATAGVLTGVPASGTGSITTTFAVDSNVWQNEPEGSPSVFTVRNEQIEILPLPDSDSVNQNIRGDYAKVATSVDSDGDSIDFQRYDMLLSFLTWRVWCKSKNDGELDRNNGFYMDFKEKMNDAIRTLPSRVSKWAPNINRMYSNQKPFSSIGEVSTETVVTGIFFTETPSGAIDSSNDTYTLLHQIDSVITFNIGTTYIHPSEYTIVGNTIVMGTPLNISLAAESFTLVYQ